MINFTSINTWITDFLNQQTENFLDDQPNIVLQMSIKVLSLALLVASGLFFYCYCIAIYWLPLALQMTHVVLFGNMLTVKQSRAGGASS